MQSKCVVEARIRNNSILTGRFVGGVETKLRQMRVFARVIRVFGVDSGLNLLLPLRRLDAN